MVRFNPEAKLIEIANGNRPVVHSVDQVRSDTYGKVVPAVDLRHQPPKTIRPI
jgi:hypothetical protein